MLEASAPSDPAGFPAKKDIGGGGGSYCPWVQCGVSARFGEIDLAPKHLLNGVERIQKCAVFYDPVVLKAQEMRGEQPDDPSGCALFELDGNDHAGGLIVVDD